MRQTAQGLGNRQFSNMTDDNGSNSNGYSSGHESRSSISSKKMATRRADGLNCSKSNEPLAGVLVNQSGTE
ncbi:unnamed protein product [Protopolystoma xenopodis]|uniref:Uncharacterized protein n=1 Tax=Protopolystoma xenopodis TaxID=117903 RepID=A0A3S5B6K2_9PLAT|nr:unnamed protein product [Protopolystoma xenopodis]